VKWDYDMNVTPPPLLFDDTNLLSIDTFSVSVDEKEHEDSQPLEDVVPDLPLLETLPCVSISTSLNSLASKHSYVHGDINCILRIYHSCIDVHRDFDSYTNGVVSIYPSASTLLHKDVANVYSLCMVDTFSSNVGLSRVFDSHSLGHNKPSFSMPLLHINTPHIDLHFHLTKNIVHGIMNSSCLLVENSCYLFMHNTYWNCNHFFAILLEMYVILKTYGKFRRLVFDPGGLVIFYLLISSTFSYSTFLITMFYFIDLRTNPFEEGGNDVRIRG